MSKKVILISIILVCIIAYHQATTAKTLLLGDINEDEKITISDMAMFKLYLVDMFELSEEQLLLADINQDSKVTITDFSLLKLILLNVREHSFVEDPTYEVELAKFSIKNNGLNWENNALGMSEAIQYAKENGYKEVKFPKGTYVIQAPTPIILESKNLIINFNNSTIKMQEEPYNSYWDMIELREPAENLIIKNGILQGNRFSEKFDITNPYNEGTVPFSIKGGNHITIEDMIIQNGSGYGMTIGTGMNRTKRIEIWANDFESGSISNTGQNEENFGTMRSKKFYPVSDLGGEFEIGYTAGYQGYPSILNQEYKAYFYDKDKTFIGSAVEKQYIKSVLPSNCEYLRLVISQTQIQDASEGSAFITNAKTFRNSSIKNSTFDGNAAVGIAIGGGQNFVIENCKFTRNGIEIDGKPALSAKVAIDIEDGWECMQNITLRKNDFRDNRYDLTSCAGSNLLLEENSFTNGCSIYARSTNYHIIKNKFKGAVNFGVSMGGNTSENVYTDASIHTFYQRFGNDKQTYLLNMCNETFHNSSIYAQNLDTKKEEQVVKNSTFTTDNKKIWIRGIFEGCTFTQANIYSGATLKHCNIKNTNIYAQDSSKYDQCYFENGNMITNSADKIFIECSKLINFPIEITTWARETILNIIDSTLTNTDSTQNILSLSAGKAKDIMLVNNEISSVSDVIQFFDTTYSIPNGKLVLTDNRILIPNNLYVINGRKIESGNYQMECRKNILNSGNLISPSYENSDSLTIIVEE